MAWTGGSGVAFVHPRLTNRGRAVIGRLVRTAGWREEQFFVCRPDDIPGNARALVAMGDESQAKLTGWSGGKRATKYTRGYELPSWTGRPVIPTFDPEMVAQGNWKLLSLMMHDVGVALGAAVGRGGVVHDPKGMVDYKEGVGALRALVQTAKADPSLLVAFDLETRGSEEEDEDETIEFSRDEEEGFEGDNPNGDDVANIGGDRGVQSSTFGGSGRSALDTARASITTVQFSVGAGSGVSVEWTPEVRELACEIVRLPNSLAGHNCFYMDTKVLMANGEWKAINHIQKGEYVRTVDKDGFLCNRQVTDLSHTKDDRSWHEVKVDGGYKRGTGRWGNPGITCTPDHKWIKFDGEKTEAQDLLPGDLVLVSRPGSSDLIFGSLLGDGSMSKTMLGRFICGHVNKEWAQAKATNLGVPLKPRVTTNGYKPGTVMWILESQVGHFWRDWFYNEDCSRKWIAPSLKSLAVWYGDDGSRTGTTATIAIHRYAEHKEVIKNWFEIHFGPCSFDHQGGVIRLKKDASEKFFTEIAPYLHPSMEYKLPAKYRGMYSGWMEKIEPQIGMVESSKPVIKEGKWAKHKYCMTVEDTHTFFTRMGLVANSWLFDRPILLNHDVPVPIETDDTMWMWHHLQPDLPAHLQGVASLWRFPFPWKHMAGSDLTFYGAADVDAVHWIMRGLPRDMKRLGIWDCYLRYVRAFRPILEEMERRGIPVSREKLAELREWLKVEVDKMDGRLQVAIPQEICLPEKKEPYAGIPNDAKAAIKLAHPAVAGLAKAKQGAALKTLGLDDPIVRQCIEAKGYGIRDGKVWKEDKQPFNPRSPLQILSYLKHQDYAIPKRFKDGKDSTADKELERLEVKTGDEVIKLTRGIRAYSKMSNAYAGKVGKDGQVEGGWYPGADGRLRCTVTYGPASAQLAARNPNCMTTPKRRPELAFQFRKCIEAEANHHILEVDYRAFHARTLGREAQDPAYYRLADLDVHSFVAGHIVHYPKIEECLDWPDDQLREYLGEIKKKHKDVRNFKAKPCILGIGFKMGARRLYFENRDTMADEAEAKKLLDLIKGLFKPVFTWQDRICEEADRKHHLINAFGHCRWFWDIFKWQRVDGEWRRSSSKDAEKCVAFLPSSNAHLALRDKLIQMNDVGWLERYGFMLPIHDALLFHCPSKLIDEAATNIKTLLEAPVKQLTDAIVASEGFTCAAEVSIGRNWAEWHEERNPEGMKEVHL